MRFLLAPMVEAVFDPVRVDSFGGRGRLAGDIPSGDQDGRAKILNAPARVQITVLEPTTYVVVARTVSRDDGTWEVLYLDPGKRFTVIGSDWAMGVNSAIQDWVHPHPIEP